jgi:hypothetical protein
MDVRAPVNAGEGGLTVNVIATTYEGTRAALTRARRLTFGLTARLVVLVPITDAEASDPALVRGCHRQVVETRALLAGLHMHAQVLACVCRRPSDLGDAVLSRVSVVVIGGRDRAFWPSPEQWLAWRLMWQGYPVVFVREGIDHVRESASASSSDRHDRRHGGAAGVRPERGGWFHRLAVRARS